MPNRAFLRAANCLTHPLTLSAIVLLLLNDHVLRIHWPSWWTGKLGDLTWVFFAPFICALFVSWIIPKTRKNQETLVGVISIGFIGIWFALAKTIPAVHDVTMSTVEVLNGWKGSIRLDVTDLIVLPILYLTWILWQKSANTNQKSSRYLLPIFVLGIFSTLASDLPESDYGLFCLQNDSQKLVAWAGEGGYSSYVSNNSGLIWEYDKNNSGYTSYTQYQTCLDGIFKRGKSWKLSDPQNTNITYRFNRGQSIERSTDRGQTWSLEYDLSEISKDVRNVYHYGQHKQTSGDVTIYLGPLDAKFDTTSGNLIVAMGWDGVLVRSPDGKWQWVAVGIYHLENLNQPQIIIPFLSANELWLAFLLIPLGLTSVLYSFEKVTCGSVVGISIAWVLWFACLIVPPEYRSNELVANFSLIAFVAFPLTALISIPLAYFELRRLRGRRAFFVLILTTANSALLFLLPFALWTQGTIGSYQTAMIFAVALAFSLLITARFLVKEAPDFGLTPIAAD